MASYKVGTTPSRASGRHKRSSSFIPQCFKSSSVLLSDDDDSDHVDHPATPPGSSSIQRRKLSRFFSLPKTRESKRTVPVETSVESPEMPTPRKSPLGRTGKDSNSKNKTRHHHHHHRQASSLSVEPATPLSSTNSRIIHSSSKSDSLTQPAPLHQMRDSARTGTTTTHGSLKGIHSPTSTSTSSSDKASLSHKKSAEAGNRDAGLLVVAVTLTALLLLGRATAVVCMSVWFYLLPRRRRAAVTQAVLVSASKKESRPVKDVIDSEEYKKRVVLQGLLERNKRKLLSRSATAPPGGIL